jgi:hypothetical protein
MEIRGSAVEDATQDLILSVTAKDIRNASSKNPSNCVVAKACRRQENLEAIIHVSRVYLRNGGKNWIRYILPKSLRGEIIAFDRGGKVYPGDFILMAPKASEKLGTYPAYGKRTGKGNVKRKPVFVTGIRPAMLAKK